MGERNTDSMSAPSGSRRVSRRRRTVGIALLLALVALLLSILPSAAHRAYQNWLYAHTDSEAVIRVDGGELILTDLPFPLLVTRDSDSAVIVACGGDGLLLSHSRDGGFTELASGLQSFGGLLSGPEGDLWISDTHAGTVLYLNADGELSFWAEGLEGPMGLVSAPDGTPLVAEALGNRITALPAPGVSHVQTELLGGPFSMAWDPEGRLLVTRFASGEIARIEEDGTVTQVATDLGAPAALVVMESGEMIVSNLHDGTLRLVSGDGGSHEVIATSMVGYPSLAVESESTILSTMPLEGVVFRHDLRDFLQ
jgi:hypothetical protein